ncbi:MAG: hypothetical protein ACP5KP_04885 [Candidatus Micrarchaeia archaeon]
MSKFNMGVKKVIEFSMVAATSLILSCAFLHRTPKVEEMVEKQAEIKQVDNWWDEVQRRVDVKKELAYWKVVLHDEWVKDTARFVEVVEGTISYTEWIGIPWGSLTREEQKERILSRLVVGTRYEDPEPASPPMYSPSPFK